MEDPTGDSVKLGDFTISLNENGSIQVFSDRYGMLIKALTSTSIMIYRASTGRNPQTIVTKDESNILVKPKTPQAGMLVRIRESEHKHLIGIEGQIIGSYKDKNGYQVVINVVNGKDETCLYRAVDCIKRLNQPYHSR